MCFSKPFTLLRVFHVDFCSCVVCGKVFLVGVNLKKMCNSCNQSCTFTPVDEISHACMCFIADVLIIERRFVLVCCTHFGVLYRPRFCVSPMPHCFHVWYEQYLNRVFGVFKLMWLSFSSFRFRILKAGRGLCTEFLIGVKYWKRMSCNSYNEFYYFTPINEISQRFMCSIVDLPIVVKPKYRLPKPLGSPLEL